MKNKINLFNNRVALIEPSGGFSGMQYYNMGMFEGLKTNGVSPFLFTSSSEKFLNSNIENIYNYFDKVWKSPYFITKFYFYIIGLIKSIIKAKKEKCHIVHLHQFHLDSNLILTIIFCKIFFNRLVLTVHDVDSFQKKKKGINIIFAFILKLLVNKFIVHNKFSSTKFSSKLKINPIIIKHGSYINFYNSKPYDPSNKKFNLLFFGLIKESKGLDVLLESLVVLKKNDIAFNLIIAGRPWQNDFSKYQNIIDNNNLNENISTHLHFISENDLITYFENCDLVILPYREIFQSGVVLKAMSLKRAVLCSNLPAFEELINDSYNGYIFESENPLSLAEKLIKINNQSEKIVDVVEVAYNILKRDFSWNDIGFNLKKLYINL